MFKVDNTTRRECLAGLMASAAASSLGGVERSTSFEGSEGKDSQHIPLKIGHRIASMGMLGDIGVFRTACQIPGLMGIELQATGGKPSLRDWDTVRRYKREADRWGIMIPSLAGVWDAGVNFTSPRARDNLNQSIQVGKLLGVSTVLIASYGEDVPDLSKESSYGPAVEVLREVASRADDAGIILGLETSLSPADHLKLVNWVGHPSVQVYYDVLNMAEYGHTNEAIPGIQLLGKSHICQVHVKNKEFLIEHPDEINWIAALEEFNKIGYEGWYVFETRHRSPAELCQDTVNNIAFLRRHCRMPSG